MRTELAKVVWVDDCSLDKALRGLLERVMSAAGITLVIAGEEDSNDGKNRGEQTVRSFRKVLDSHADDPNSIVGFLMDIQIPGDTLSHFDQRYKEIPTNSGRDTGFQLVKFILNNYGGSGDQSSLYGDIYKEIPVLYLSISSSGLLHRNGKVYNEFEFTEWMEDRYRDLSVNKVNEGGVFLQYCHLKKKILKNDPKQLEAWIETVVNEKRSR